MMNKDAAWLTILVLLVAIPVRAELVVRAVRQAAPLSTGNQTFTVTNFGGNTPKAVLFLISSGETDGVGNPLSFGTGATDCTNQWASGFAQEDAQSTPTNHRGGGNDKLLSFRDWDNASTEVGRAVLVSCQANSVTINWTAVSGRQEQVMAIMWSGSDVTAHVGINDASLAIDGIVDVNVGLEADFLILMNYCITGGAPLDFPMAQLSFGVGTRTGNTQLSYSFTSAPTAMPTDVYTHFSITDGVFAMSDASNLRCVVANVEDYDATGWSYRTNANDIGSGGKGIFHLALAFSGAAASDVRRVQTSTTTGSKTWSGLPFTPQAAFVIGTQLTAAGVVETSDGTPHEGFGFGYVDDQFEASMSGTSDDNLSSTNTVAQTDSLMLSVSDRGGLPAYQHDFLNFTADGITYSQTTAAASAYDVILVTFNGGGASPSLTRRRRPIVFQ